MKHFFTLSVLVATLVFSNLFGQNTFPTTGNVGIGTTTPQARLHINNGNNSYGAILANSSKTPISLYTKTLDSLVNTETFRLGLKFNNDERNGYISFYSGSSSLGGFLGFSTNGLERIRIANSGRVGIGTSAPETPLHVAGTTRIRRDTLGFVDIVSGDATKSGYIGFFTPEGRRRGTIGLATSTNLNYTSESGAHHIFNGGNVGIGITTPAAKLDVNGSIINRGFEFKLGNGDQVTRGDSGASRALVKILNSTTRESALYINYGGDYKAGTVVSSNLGVGVMPTERLDVNGNLRIRGNLVLDKPFLVDISSALSKLRDNTDWNLTAYKNGIYRKVGGANNPFGSSHATILSIGQADGSSYGFQLAANDKSGGLKFRGFSVANDFSQWFDIYHSGNFNQSLLTNAVPNVAFKNIDNRFSVNQTFNGSLLFRKSDGTGTPSLDLSGSGLYLHLAGSGLIARTDNIQDIGISSYRFRDLWLGRNAYINGNLGIGTTAPTDKLHIVGSTRLQGVLKDGANLPGTNGQILSSTGTATAWKTLTKSDVGLANIDNTSDISKPISTATQNALNQKQNALVSGTNIKTINGQSLMGTGNITLNTTTTNQLSLSGNTLSSTVNGITSQIELLGLGKQWLETGTNLSYSLGHVSIGTNTPKTEGNGKLTVAGKIWAEEVEVIADITANGFNTKPQTWADYVFEEDYKLMPLAELQKYIQQNGHLPNLPTTAEATQKGVELTELNVKLLEKIEELTLYTLEQEEKINKLTVLVEQLLENQSEKK